MTQLLLSLECQQLLLLENSTGRRLNSLKCGLFLEPSTIFCSVLDFTQYSYVMTVTVFSHSYHPFTLLLFFSIFRFSETHIILITVLDFQHVQPIKYTQFDILAGVCFRWSFI